MDISKNAKLLYALLSDRTTLSQKNALNELDEAGLLERKRAGFSASNRLYVKLSPFFQIPDPMMDGKTSPNNIAANGKAYQNYASALRIWAENDKKATPKQGIPDYTCKEGESL